MGVASIARRTGAVFDPVATTAVILSAMSGAPPKGNDGENASLNGAPIVAGLHHPTRWFSQRARDEDLWADLSIAATPTGASSLPTPPTAADAARFASYLTQARSFYLAAVMIDIRSRPLPAYYAVLNLAKAWLTLVAPATTAGKLRHGSADNRHTAAGPYNIAHEQFLVQAVQGGGVLGEVAKRTGANFAHAVDTTIPLSAVMPTLCEAFDYAPRILGPGSSLLPLVGVTVQQGQVQKPNGQASGCLWLQAELDRGTAVSPATLLGASPQFASVFHHVRGKPGGPYRLESQPHRYGVNTKIKVPNVLADLSKAMLFVDRTSARRRYFVLRASAAELSQEARTFAVMLHLSNMVRYRPEHVESLAASPDSWLLSTWVPRALENSLLTYSARIMQRETFIE